MKQIFLILAFLGCALTAFSQRSYYDAIGFSQHLVKLQQHPDAVTVLKDIRHSSLSRAQIDSVNHLIGYAFYLNKDLDSSIAYFDKVSDQSNVFTKSNYYSVINTLYKGASQYKLAESRLLSMQSDTGTRQLWLTELGGIMLLERDYRRFDSISKYFDHSFYAVYKEQQELERYYARMMKVKSKSPFIAGTLSAIVPGMGKLYAGYRGKALSSFLSVSTLALVATESYIKDGAKSPSFIIFSSLFSVFYVGNIWGSVLSVRIKQDETFREFDRNILLDLHIPLRRIYN